VTIVVNRQAHHAGSGKCRGGKAMQFSVGDKVVHPHYGPGRVASVERRELMDGPKRYYVIDIPSQGLTVHIPVGKADEMGVRSAMSQSRLPQVLSMLRGRPRPLPENYKERQEQVYAELETGRVMHLARVVRDLTWHRQRAHLTKRDNDYLRQGRELLAAEMALVSGDDVSEVNELIEATMVAAVAGLVN
jgi:CarD family transcriptional regulator